MSRASPRHPRSPRRYLPSVGWSTRVALLLLLAVFFGVPLIWLAIAPSKVQNEFVTLPALAFGEVANYARAWDHLITFDDGQISVGWAWNSLWYTAAAMVIGLVDLHPGRVRPRDLPVPRAAPDPVADAGRPHRARVGSRAAVVPGDELHRPGRKPVGGDLPTASSRSASSSPTCSTRRASPRTCLPRGAWMAAPNGSSSARSACPSPRRSSRCSPSSASRPTGTTTSCHS